MILLGERMLGKREVYVGVRNEKYDRVVRDLQQTGIKYSLRVNDASHGMDVSRGGAVERFAENVSEQNLTVSVYVHKRDYETAIGLLTREKAR